jgi:4-cresol dehydrogenase (hydroxylating)
MPGTVVLDLGRMNRILDVDARFGYCLLEPGVGFFDLYNYLQANKIPLWMSIPGNAWGSVMGNALERGLGYTPYGDHASKICGMEVVLPTGELLRTGSGAMAASATWQHYQHGFGPSWDQAFVQSSFGVVTKMGLWLMPEPEMTKRVKIELPQADDIVWAIDELAKLRLHNVIEHNFVFGNYLHDAAVFSQRDEWYRGPGALPDAVAEKIMAH